MNKNMNIFGRRISMTAAIGILLIMAASAGVVFLVFQPVNMNLVYQTSSPPSDLGFTLVDGDPTDEISFSYNGESIPDAGYLILNADIWDNQQVLYTDAAILTPTRDGILQMTNIYRSDNGIKNFILYISDPADVVEEIPITVDVTTHSMPVSAGVEYKLEYLVLTEVHTMGSETVTVTFSMD